MNKEILKVAKQLKRNFGVALPTLTGKDDVDISALAYKVNEACRIGWLMKLAEETGTPVIGRTSTRYIKLEEAVKFCFDYQYQLYALADKKVSAFENARNVELYAWLLAYSDVNNQKISCAEATSLKVAKSVCAHLEGLTFKPKSELINHPWFTPMMLHHLANSLNVIFRLNKFSKDKVLMKKLNGIIQHFKP